ncbi:MAG: ABC transporter substrate-binding protein [Aestuariivirgaceae bacterium]
MVAGLTAASAWFGPTTVVAGETIKIGELNSYTRLPAFTDPYRKGWELAVEEINAGGGVNGKMLEVIARDDNGKPGDAVKIAEELVRKEGVALLAGTYFSHVGLAVTEYAKQNKVLFVAAEPLSDAVVWAKGNRYTFRLRPSTYMQAAMLAKEAVKTGAKRWVTVAPNYAYGKDAVAAFKTNLKRLDPEVEFVDEQWPALFKIDAGATVRALEASKPEGIYNVTFGGDLAKFVREGSLRGLFENRTVVSLLTGEPEYLNPLKGEAPRGWIVTGYPAEQITDAAHQKFFDAYKAKYSEPPKAGSLVGYNTFNAIATLLGKAKAHDTETLVDTMKGLTVEAPSGALTFRAIDHQSTMGAWVGRTDVKDGKGMMVDWYYADGADFLPSDEEVGKLRPAE